MKGHSAITLSGRVATLQHVVLREDSARLSSVRKPLKVSAEGSIGVLTGRRFQTSSSILVLLPTVPLAAPVRICFLHGDCAFWKTKIQLWNVSR